jgi:hypothetical protein
MTSLDVAGESGDVGSARGRARAGDGDGLTVGADDGADAVAAA